MKLLTHPSSTIETITVGGAVPFIETYFSPLGLLGVGPLFKSRKVTRHVPKINFAGRQTLDPVDIDFEDTDPKAECFTYDDKFLDYRKVDRKEGWAFELGGRKYVLHGMFPLERLHGNVWRCSIDRVEESRPQ